MRWWVRVLAGPVVGVLLGSSVAIAGGGAADSGFVAPPTAAGLTLRDGWVRAVPPVSRNSAGYIVLENRGAADDALVGARVQKVRVTELHEMVRDGETMTMRHRQEIPVPAGSTVALAPGGMHLMLIDLQQPLVVGERLEAVLQFRAAGERRVLLEVRAP